MPFNRESDGTVNWTPPSNKDIRDVDKEIRTRNEPGEVDINDRIRSKLDAVVDSMSPSRGWGVIVQSNAKIYDTIKALATSSRGLVDIVMPVHNSIHITKKAIEAVMERTSWPFHLYLVDDASDQFTNDELQALQKKYKKNITLITNAKNRGFAATTNRGIKAGNGEYVCLLNSDVIVTPLWLTKMIMAQKADKRNQIVCPATNNTAMVAIPLSEGGSYLQMNRVFEKYAVRQYPEIMPTGFCFLFRRDLLKKVGYLDEGYKNFGEETDWWMRVIHYVDGDNYPRYRAVMADDCYVFHERGSSFSKHSDDSQMHMRKLASTRFGELWPQFNHWKKTYNVNRALGHLKDPIPGTLLHQEGKYRICWVVHSTTMCGGMRYIADIVNEINERGGDASVALIKRKPESEEDYIGELRTAPAIFESYDDFVSTFNQRVFDKGVVVAATAELVGAVKILCSENTELKPVLHVQSYEPDMIAPTTPEDVVKTVKMAFKVFPDVISNSKWITEKLESDLGVNPFSTISPGVDRELFYPRGRNNGDDRPTVMIPMIPNYPCKGYDRGLGLIKSIERVAEERGVEARILVYGTSNINIRSSAICLGRLNQVRLANLLGTEVDVFIDPSTLHSYGLPALEAIASGVSVVAWNNLGIKEYVNEEMVPMFDSDATTDTVAESIVDLLEDEARRDKVVKASSVVLDHHDRNKSVASFIEILEKQMKINIVSRKINVVVPHLRKHGGPTTMVEIANKLADDGHDVSITTVYTDVNPEVTAMTELPISVDAQNIPKCDLIITNSDNPMSEALSNRPKVKKKIMLKLSHNPRFKQLEEQGLQCDWDAVVTSTDWLKAVCENPTEGWDYKPTKATRIGWWHYGHNIMKANPSERTYHTGEVGNPITIGFLVHQHPSKGTQDAVIGLSAVLKETDLDLSFLGVGEVPPSKFSAHLPNFNYIFSPNRHEMAEVLKTCDIWLSASHTEGLGRMALEAMSAGCLCVLSDTGAEFAKNKENCLMYPVGDTAAMTAALRLAIHDKKLGQRIKEHGFDTAYLLSRPNKCMEKLEEVIREVFDG